LKEKGNHLLTDSNFIYFDMNNVMPLDKIDATIKSGEERLSYNNQILKFTLLDFWRWSASDILSNATRGVLAEFIVATATNIDITKVRDEWSAFDLITPTGIKLEIKSAAYLQSWFQRTLSTISFSTKLARHWDSATNIQATVAKRHADVYVFCLLKHENKLTVDPMNLDHWDFYVLATEELNNYKRSQYSITLKSLRGLTSAIGYDRLNDEITLKNSYNKPFPDFVGDKANEM
jgi:hypothetical protein